MLPAAQRGLAGPLRPARPPRSCVCACASRRCDAQRAAGLTRPGRGDSQAQPRPSPSLASPDGGFISEPEPVPRGGFARRLGSGWGCAALRCGPASGQRQASAQRGPATGRPTVGKTGGAFLRRPGHPARPARQQVAACGQCGQCGLTAGATISRTVVWGSPKHLDCALLRPTRARGTRGGMCHMPL